MGKIKKTFLKKVSLLLLSTVTILGIGVSCGTDNKDSASSKEVVEKTSKEEKEIYVIGEEVKLEDAILKVNSIDKSSGSEWDKPKEGSEFIVVNVTIKNSGTSQIAYNSFDFQMQNSKGQIIDQAFTTIDKNTTLNSGELASNGEVTGTIVFEQPIEEKELILIYKTNMFSDKNVKVKLN